MANSKAHEPSHVPSCDPCDALAGRVVGYLTHTHDINVGPSRALLYSILILRVKYHILWQYCTVGKKKKHVKNSVILL